MRTTVFYIANETTPFGVILPIHKIVVDREANKAWEILAVGQPTDTLATIEKELMFGGGGGTMFIDDRLTPVAIFGLPANSTFPEPGEEIVEVVRKILYPYQYPAFASFVQADYFKEIEIGALLDDIVDASFSISNFSNIKVGSSISGSCPKAEVTFSPVPAVVSGFISMTLNALLLDIPENISCTLTGINSNNENFTISRSIQARRKYYQVQGDAGISPVTSAQIRLLTQGFLSLSDTKSFSVVINGDAIVANRSKEFSIYAPQGSSISVIDTDALNLELSSSFVKSAVTIEHGNGVISTYDKYTIDLGSGYTTDHNYNIVIS